MQLDQLEEDIAVLVCPTSNLPLTVVSREEALTALGEDLVRQAAVDEAGDLSETVLMRADGTACFRIVDGIPILIAPEMLTSRQNAVRIDTSRDPYREAYEEMDFYDTVADRDRNEVTKSTAYQIVKRALEGGEYLQPGWIDATYDSVAQVDAYRHMVPLAGRRTMQIGGRGIHAVKFILAGVDESWLVTPMLGEALFARALAGAFGVQNRLHCVVAIGEQLPFRNACFDRVYAGGCIHHTITDVAFPEIARVLSPGGKFAAVEPWRAPLYGIGTKILGKREVGVNCRPIDRKRVEPLFRSFDSADVIHHGALTRYPLLALYKLGLKISVRANQRIMEIDDRVTSLMPLLRERGSSVALLGAKKAVQHSPAPSALC